jgi:hypothetical protein
MKGGYKIKEGFYIKDDCKNNEEEGMIDEHGYILDPFTFEKIPEQQLIQLSDGYCYDKQNSRQLLTVINRSNRLPFGHNVKSADRRKLRNSTSETSSPKSLTLSSIPPSTISQLELSPLESSISSEEILNIPQNLEIQNVPEELAVRPRRNRPRLIIESASPEEVNPQHGRVHWSPDSQGNWVRQIVPTNQAQQPLIIESPEEIEIVPRRRTRRIREPPVRRQTRRRRPLLIIESSSPEIVAEEDDPFGEVEPIIDYRDRLGQGIKRKYKKRKTKKHKKTRKTRKYLIRK